MNPDALVSFSKGELIALIEALTKQIDVLTKRVAALEAELGKPSKTPDNSSVPPSQGHKASGERAKAEGQAPCRLSPAAASEPDAAARCPG